MSTASPQRSIGFARILRTPVRVAFLYTLFALLTSAPLVSLGQQSQDESDELSLEKLFPEDGLFGTSAQRMSFSEDGRYAAFLYRPYLERRHGNDLWLYDFDTSQLRRLTRASVMAEFQKRAREVRDDRMEKAKKHGEEQAEEGDGETELSDEQQAGDWVGEEDADDDEAPRYSGVSSYVWNPISNEIMLVSEGDLYRLDIADGAITRLTRTQESESAVTFLPDGSGYLYMSDSNLMKVVFDSHFIEQIDPKLPGGEEMSDYSLSPDGKRLALVTRKGDSPFSGDRRVNIVNYRNRFAEVREVPRVVADDPRPEQQIQYYFYDLEQNDTEESELTKIYETKMDGPRDVISSPEWAPDSSRVTFATFDQEEEEVHVMMAVYPEPSDDESADESADDKEIEEAAKAQLVYRFLHFGGPNTPRMIRPEFTYDSRKIVMLSEQSGFRHVHLLDPLYQSLQQVTAGHFEVYPQDISEDHRWLFVTATKDNSAREEIYRINLETLEMEKLSQVEGNYSSVAVSDDGSRVLANFVTFGELRELVRIDMQKSEKQVVLTDSHPEATLELIEPMPEFFTYENRHGHTIHGLMFKPDDWRADDQRPLLIYVYGGPLGTRKMVVDGSYSSDSYFFAYYMAKQHGYVTVTIDPRGLSGYGGIFEKANYEQIGKPQVEDLVDGVEFLVANHGVDEERVGIHGWSFGGFQTQMCLYTAPEVFSVGIAGAGPTEWENYNAWYTTGTVGPSREGKTDQEQYSLLPLAKNLEGKLLLIHGMEDSNVLYQDTVRVYRELLKAGKETLVELFLDPTGGHGLGGDVKRLNRYRKYEEFLLRTLETGE